MVAFWIPLFSGMTACHRDAEKQCGSGFFSWEDNLVFLLSGNVSSA